MSQVPPVTISAATPSASVGEAVAAGAGTGAGASSASEKNATTSMSPSSTQLRSCVVCRSRKVRCDKLSPCSNCRRAKIACVFPSTDRPPRWARRLERVANNQNPDPAAAQVMERLRKLESLVKDLSGQLEQANAAAAAGSAAGSAAAGSPRSGVNTDYQRDASPSTNTGNDNVQTQFGRLVLQEDSTNRSRYVSSGFWSRVNDELDGLKMDSSRLGPGDSDTSEDEDEESTQELKRTPSERHAFLFQHNLSPSAPNLHEFHPLPSQIPLLLDVFSDNVNSVTRIVHVPTVAKMVRHLRGSDMTSLTPANEALMFSIYYAAITSMEDDDIMTNFGSSKSDLNLKYRLGLEHALARADFLNVPDLVLVQALAIFLCLVRRHDSPRFVWMMTGLVIRMGQALGLHRDGTHFEHLTPYEIEMRRRVWWALCMLDVRASEDQGTEYTIARGSFDTKLPLNINEVDIEPETTQMPTERDGITDMTFLLAMYEIGEVTKRMLAQSAKEGVLGMEEQNRLLDEMYRKLDRGYLQYSVESGNITYWVGVNVTRLMMAKMTLFVYLPILFSSPSEHSSDEIKTKLLIAAIETAEYNHALNSELACRHWRWVYQTYTHWHAVVYLLIEICRRQWSPIVERAWVALHSPWLIPAQSHIDKNLRVWVPLRKLTAKARKHRNAELERLRSDPWAAERLEMEDQRIPVPTSPGPFPAGSNVVELFHERWHQLLAMSEGSEYDTRTPAQSGHVATNPSAHSTCTTQPSKNSIRTYNAGGLGSNSTFEAPYLGDSSLRTSQKLPSHASLDLQSAMTTNDPSHFATGQTTEPSYNAVPVLPTTWSMGPGFAHWLWADADPSVDVFANVDIDGIDINMDLDSEVDWYNWVESAKGI
ncbi:hypothetical protein G7Y89_g2055 [Cudoniella acicularis]|uniref:Zn(2)-C6 fungal-type domain-containing protein n=1 Tax=Cudoniella acicularis TaxID=354080 RepID=A0A8H4W6V3_9HELO|nr:hypothetical protein G7Y89_g2055 [Cudoniella acicularis]